MYRVQPENIVNLKSKYILRYITMCGDMITRTRMLSQVVLQLYETKLAVVVSCIFVCIRLNS